MFGHQLEAAIGFGHLFHLSLGFFAGLAFLANYLLILVVMPLQQGEPTLCLDWIGSFIFLFFLFVLTLGFRPILRLGRGCRFRTDLRCRWYIVRRVQIAHQEIC